MYAQLTVLKYVASTVALLTLLILSIVLIIYLIDYLNPLWRMPGPKFKHPITGDLGEHIRNGCRVLKDCLERREKYGKIRKIHMVFGEIRVEIADPVWAQHVLLHNAHNYARGTFRGAEGIKTLLRGSSLLMTSGFQHRRLRKLANPAFRQQLLETYVEMFQDICPRLFAKWDLEADAKAVPHPDKPHGGTVIYVKDDLSKLTLDIIGLTSFGYDFQSFCAGPSSEFCETFHLTVERGDLSLISTIPWFWTVCRAVAVVASVVKLQHGSVLWQLHDHFDRVSRLHGHIRGINREIAEKRRSFEQIQKPGKPVNLEKPDDTFWQQAKKNKNGYPNLVAFIMSDNGEENGNCLSEDELQDMTMTFLLAGHETSSLALTWLLLNLALNEDCQEKCRQEIKHVLFSSADESRISWHMLQEFRYLNNCILESLRLNPPAPYVNRSALSEDIIDGYRVPKGTDILVTLVEIHRDADVWDQPHEFLPERFEDPALVPWDHYLPFGYGVHKCIGYQFATAEIIVLAAMLIKRYAFAICEGDTYVERAHVTLTPNPAVRLRVSRIA